jgi:hypothetical protein
MRPQCASSFETRRAAAPQDEGEFGVLANMSTMAILSLIPSFRDAPLGAGPESILPAVVMDSGLTLRVPRNDEVARLVDK